MAFYGEDQVRKVKEATDLVQLVADYAPVQRAGATFKACCPFHVEKSPSFVIYTDSQHYHCYGCGAHGDAITLIREKENLEFSEALEFLARRAGVQIEAQGGGDSARERGNRERLLQIMEWATAGYERCLWDRPEGAEARAYLAERGLGEEVCRRFRLGWAPGRNRLLDAGRRERHPDAVLLQLDLVQDRSGRLGDRFYDRLLFPICDRYGRPIAFSGRLLPEAQRRAREEGRGVGKYVNSKDTPLYHKGSVIYNLHQARSRCRDAGRIVVMEGPTDVMAAAQAGISECVAVLGTALTAEHAKQLGGVMGDRGHVVLLFDGDEAGQANSVKAVRTCLSVGVVTRVSVMPEGKDPAELLAGGGPDAVRAFEAVLGAQRGDLPHVLRSLAPRPHALDQHARLQVVDAVLDCIRPLPDADLRDAYLEEAARYLGLEHERLHRRLGAALEPAEEVPAAAAPAPPLDPAQETVLHLLVRRPDLRGAAFDELGVEPVLFPLPWRRLPEALVAAPEADLDALRDLLDAEPALREACFRWLREGRTQHGLDLADAEAVLRDAVAQLRGRALDGELRRLEHEMRLAEEGGDHDRVAALFREHAELKRRRVAAGR